MNGVLEWWQNPRHVVVVVDTPGWFDTHAESLAEKVRDGGDRVDLVRSYDEIGKPDIAFYLSCRRITPPEVLARARVNLVAHASDLPSGRGFSPVVWQILDGASQIPIKLIYAATQVDSGDIVMSDRIDLDGHELNDEIRAKLGERIVAMCMAYLSAEAPPAGVPQKGEPSWYGRRGPEDSRLDPGRSIAGQFELLRVVDNQRYPAFFELRGHRYLLRIEKAGSEGKDPTGHEDEG